MTTIRLLDARRGLSLKCRELFGDEKIADAIYRYLCDGIEECEDAEPERKTGKWMPIIESNENGEPYQSGIYCNNCGYTSVCEDNFCPNCGARMDEVTLP